MYPVYGITRGLPINTSTKLNKLSKIILKLTPREMAIDTLKKNTILDVSKWRILKHLILDLLEKTLHACHAPPFHRVSAIACRFGERDPNQFKLANDFCIEQITNVTTHVAVTFRTDEDRIHLFWSRDRIQKLIDFRGTLNPALFFRDCCNVQTNLDGRSLDISEELKNVCKFPENMFFFCNFMQIHNICIATQSILFPVLLEHVIYYIPSLPLPFFDSLRSISLFVCKIKKIGRGNVNTPRNCCIFGRNTI